jgi:hypothetical protein
VAFLCYQRIRLEDDMEEILVDDEGRCQYYEELEKFKFD